MKKAAACVVSVVDACLIHIVTLYAIIYFGIMRTAFFMHLYETKYDVVEALGTTSQGLLKVVGAFLGFIKGRTTSAQVAITIDGTLQPFFNEKELAHLSDIAGVVRLCSCIAAVVLVLAMLLTLLLWHGRQMKFLRRAWLGLVLVVLCTCGILGICYIRNPLGVVNRFHLMFFTNTLWVMNEQTDLFLQLFPTAIYGDCLVAIGIGMGIAYVVGVVGCVGISVIEKHKGKIDKKPSDESGMEGES